MYACTRTEGCQVKRTCPTFGLLGPTFVQVMRIDFDVVHFRNGYDDAICGVDVAVHLYLLQRHCGLQLEKEKKIVDKQNEKDSHEW